MKFMFKYGVIVVVMSFCFHLSSCGYQSPRYVKIADEITAKTAARLEKEKKLSLIGTGGGMMNDIQAMHMSFQYYQEVDVKAARELIVYAVHEYLKAINSNEEVRPFLHNYPFTAKNIKIRIWVCNPDMTRLPSDKICYISALNGELDYYIRGPKQYSRIAICEETYEEALKLTSIEKSSPIYQLKGLIVFFEEIH